MSMDMEKIKYERTGTVPMVLPPHESCGYASPPAVVPGATAETVEGES
jgi:hypothetical protein